LSKQYASSFPKYYKSLVAKFKQEKLIVNEWSILEIRQYRSLFSHELPIYHVPFQALFGVRMVYKLINRSRVLMENAADIASGPEGFLHQFVRGFSARPSHRYHLNPNFQSEVLQGGARAGTVKWTGLDLVLLTAESTIRSLVTKRLE